MGLYSPFVFKVPLIIIRIIIVYIIVIKTTIIIIIIIIVDLFLLQLVVDHTGQLLQALVEQHFDYFFTFPTRTWKKYSKNFHYSTGNNALCVCIFFFKDIYTISFY